MKEFKEKITYDTDVYVTKFGTEFDTESEAIKAEEQEAHGMYKLYNLCTFGDYPRKEWFLVYLKDKDDYERFMYYAYKTHRTTCDMFQEPSLFPFKCIVEISDGSINRTSLTETTLNKFKHNVKMFGKFLEEEVNE